jgi:pyridoxamine 5'-phosphate oxidase
MQLDGAHSNDPWQWFGDSFDRAARSESFDAGRAALATVSAAGQPSVRFVLVKAFGPRGFVFYTNLRSAKADDLRAEPRAALAFHWASIGEQVRAEGAVELVSDEEADAYFSTRPRPAQLSAWASAQSQTIASRQRLDEKLAEVERRFAGASELPRPSFWGGYRLSPTRIEFWRDREGRLHDRWSFTREVAQWRLQRLQP